LQACRELPGSSEAIWGILTWAGLGCNSPGVSWEAIREIVLTGRAEDRYNFLWARPGVPLFVFNFTLKKTVFYSDRERKPMFATSNSKNRVAL